MELQDPADSVPERDAQPHRGLPRLTESRCLEYVRGQQFFDPELPNPSMAVEISFGVVDTAGRSDRENNQLIARCLGERGAQAGPDIGQREPIGVLSVPLSGGGTLSHGPGTQITYSSPFLADPLELVAHLRVHVGGAAHALESLGLRPVFLGLPSHVSGPRRTPDRQQSALDALWQSRAGESHTLHNRYGCGMTFRFPPDRFLPLRLEVARRLSPVVAAMFCNSPIRDGRSTPWVSRRLQHALDADPLRYGLPPWSQHADPAQTAADQALDAPVGLIDDGRGVLSSGPPGTSFRDWIAQESSTASLRDWRHHLSTMEPLVWIRGALEVRAPDVVPLPWLPVPVLIMWGLWHRVRPEVWISTEAVPQIHLADVAERGLRHPEVLPIARRVFDRGLRALRHPTQSISASVLDAVESYRRLYIERGRMPADDALDWALQRPQSQEHEVDGP